MLITCPFNPDSCGGLYCVSYAKTICVRMLLSVWLALAKRELYPRFEKQQWSSDHIPSRLTWLDAVAYRCRGARRCWQVPTGPCSASSFCFWLLTPPDPQWLPAHSWTLHSGLTDVVASQKHASHRPRHEPSFRSPFQGLDILGFSDCLSGHSYSNLPTSCLDFTCPALSLTIWDDTYNKSLAHDSWWVSVS